MRMIIESRQLLEDDGRAVACSWGPEFSVAHMRSVRTMTKMTGGLLSCALCFSSGTALADTYTVNGDGSADFLTITAAVAAAQDGDVILVNAGLYEEGPISLLGKRIVINGVLGGVDSVKVRSAVTGEPVFEVVSGEPSGTALANLTIEQAQTKESGAGVRVENGSELVMVGCMILDNTSEGSGGGLYVSYDSRISLSGCTFRGNAGSTGGGVCIGAPGDCSVSRCSFEGNAAYNGAGLLIGDPEVFNRPPIGLSPPRIISCVFSGNIAENRGGAINIFPYDDPDDGEAGAIGYIDNCTFSLNEAYRYGVAWAATELGSTAMDLVEFRGCILWKNQGGPPGFFDDDGGGESLVTDVPLGYSYCIVDQDMQDAFAGVDMSDGISARDPRFKSDLGKDGFPGTGDEDFSVLPGSPAIDSGTDAVNLSSSHDDRSGDSRRVDDPNTVDGPGTARPAIDRGAYEFDPADLDGMGFALWTGGGSDFGILDADNWYDGMVSDADHLWVFDDGPTSLAWVESANATIGGLMVASGILVLEESIGSTAILRFKDGEGSLDYASIEVAPYASDEADLRVFGLSLWCEGVVIHGGGAVHQETSEFQLFNGGTLRLDAFDSFMTVNGALGTTLIRQVGSSSAPALLNLGTTRVVSGVLEIEGGYAQTGTRLDGTVANGLLEMDLLGESCRLEIDSQAALAGGIQFNLGQQTPPIEAGNEFTVLSAAAGLGDTMFDFAITSGDTGDFFMLLTTTSGLFGSEDVVATVVSLDELLSGDPSSHGSTADMLADMILADIDGDGFKDLVLSVDTGPGSDGSVVVLLNAQTSGGEWQGFEVFSGAYAAVVEKQPRGLDVGFIDEDDMLDIVVANYESGTVSVLINESTIGSVSLNGSIVSPLDADPDLPGPDSSFPLDVCVKDLDSDAGALSDILVTNERDGSVWAFQNLSGSLMGTSLGNATKSNPPKAIVEFSPGRGGSGRDDDTTGSSDEDDGVGSGSVGSMTGPGIVMLWTAYDTPTGSAPADLAVGDFDGDGFSDIATANTGGDSISIFLGLGGGIYGAASTFSLGTNYSAPISISAGDLDDDGDLDLAYVVMSDLLPGNVSRVLRNTLDPPGGSFGWVVETDDELGGQAPYLVRTADVDNDGDDDVVVLVATAPSPLTAAESGRLVGYASTEMLANSPGEETCLGDFDEDGLVGGSDLAQLLGAWGTDDPAIELSGDTLIDGADLALLLGAWGPCSSGSPLD